MVEDLTSDEAYFLLKSNLTHRLAHNQHLNKKGSKSSSYDKTAEFWRRVEPESLKKFYELYQPDFELFGYTVDKYTKQQGLS